MKSKKNTKNKSRAQAMVEFAIALPVLLMLLYGILEAGRLMFLYSTVVTASRQAVRFGSATGENLSGTPRYQDCDGIRAAATRAAFLGPLDTITILHDGGPSTGQTTYCGGPTDTWTPTGNSQRLIVTVQEQFTPIVPNLVPFITRTITATSARTIITSVAIEVTPSGGGGGGGGGGDLVLAISTNPTSFGPPNAGQTINVFYLVTNNGTVNLNTPITFTGFNGSSPNCTGEPATLTAGGGSFTCTGTYTVTQPNMDDGFLTVSATANVDGLSDYDIETILGTFSPALTLEKSGPTYVEAANNTSFDYTYILTNSGNVTLSAPYEIVDDKVASNAITCLSSADIAPGGSVQCNGTYTIRNSDISTGFVTNIATATATFNHPSSGAQTVTSNSDQWTVITPAVYLSVSASPASVTSVGQTITYTYRLRNNIASTIKAPYTVSDSRVTNETCPSPVGTLNPGGEVTCTGTYTVTQADLDAGGTLTSTISGTATKATNPGANSTLTSNIVTFSLPVIQNTSLSLAVAAAPNTATVLNTVVTYTYTLTNNGNVNLSSPSITDDKATVTCADTSPIAPGATRVCTGTRTISQADLDDGSVISTATAQTTLGTGTVNSNTVSTTVITFVGARLTLVITANPNPAIGSGQIITFTYTLRNTGNVVLSTPYSVIGTLTGTADCSTASATIPVGGSTTCVGFYTTQPGDVGTSITDSATATAMDVAATVTSNNATLIVPVNP